MISLIDTIGIESGMNLYDKTFHDKLREIDVESCVVSNYSDSFSLPLFSNFYKGNTFVKIFRLILSWFRLFYYSIRNRSNIFIYQSFGLRYIDMFFILIFIFRRKFVVIVHDVYEITRSSNKIKQYLQNFFYRNIIKNVVCHSSQAQDTLVNKVHFVGNVIYFPHFSYNFSKSYDVDLISEDIRTAIVKNKINLLFFGQVRESKGIHILLDAVKLVSSDSRFNFIVAGSDKQKLIDHHIQIDNLKLILRYISDMELNYLFENVDCVVLPYKEIYQSGVLETVVYFRKYAILSDVSSFIDFINKYNSFGIVYSPNTSESLSNCIRHLDFNSVSYEYDDIQLYESDHDISFFYKRLVSICN